MKTSHLILNKLSVYKLPGFTKGLKDFSGLSPHLNIVAGPNGSGKSSTARLIQKLLWRLPAEGTHADGTFVTGPEKWYVKSDHGSVVMQKDGISAALPGMPDSEMMPRYMLAMHDLVRADEQDMASEMLKMAIGGYDLNIARQRLGYEAGIRPRNAREYRAMEEAARILAETDRAQKALKGQEERLVVLEKEKRLAEEAARLLEFYERCRDYLLAREYHRQCAATMDSLPAALLHAYPDDHEQLLKREELAEACRVATEKAAHEIGAAEDSIASLGLPAGGFDAEEEAALRIHIEELTRLERQSEEQTQAMSAAGESAKQVLGGIGQGAAPEAWNDITLDDVGRLDEFLLTAQQALGDQQHARQKILRLGKEAAAIPQHDADSIREGKRLLTYWLREHKSYHGVKATWIVILAAMAVLTALASWQFGAAGLAGLLAVAAAATMAWLQRPTASKMTYQSDYERSGLDLPAAWEAGAVTDLADQLADRLAACSRKEQMLQEVKLLRQEEETAEENLKQVAAQHAAWLQKLQVMPDLPTENLNRFSTMYHFLIRLKEWQRHNLMARDAEARGKVLAAEIALRLQKVNDILSRYGNRTANDAATARAALDTLAMKEQQRKELLAQIRVADVTTREKESQMRKAVQEIEAVYDRLGLEAGNREGVRLLLEQLPNFNTCREELAIASRTLSGDSDRLKGHALFTEKGEQAMELHPADIDPLIAEYSRISERREEIMNEMTRINTLVEQARSGHDLEQALLRKEEATESLATLFENNLSSLTGNLICHTLKEEMREKTLPGVFYHAQQLFGTITQGRYELLIDDTDKAVFAARDTVLGQGLALDQLSTGTRIQLLIAVRLAYVETHEAGLKLPLLADELLANSDDTRARAIMEALIEISRGGRQVFYFSAQHDEVVKWEEVLRSHPDIGYQVIRLTGDNNEAAAVTAAVDFTAARVWRDMVPEPGSRSHAAYGELLKVPRFDILSDPAESLHLWYLVDDPKTLYQCLKISVRHRGQLKSFLKSGGVIEGLDETTMERIDRHAELAKRFCELYRTGRPRRIDRQVLVDSGAVTPAFIDQVNELLNKLNGNPETLIHELKTGNISRFRESSTEKLESYLEENGYIPAQPPLDDDAIMLQLKAYSSHAGIDPSEAQNLMNRLLQ